MAFLRPRCKIVVKNFEQEIAALMNIEESALVSVGL